jgi:hypothetical protein
LYKKTSSKPNPTYMKIDKKPADHLHNLHKNYVV